MECYVPKFSEKTIDQIKNRLSISDVMSNYALIESKGGSKWVKCPFHGGGNERTASCKLDDNRGTFYCFGCHEGGDIFSLVMKKEGLDFSSSVEYLANKAGVELLEDNSINSEDRKKFKENKESMYELYARLSKTFRYLLNTSNEAQHARDYLKKRNVSEEMQEKFLLGFAPSNPSWLYSFLSSKGYSESFLVQSGLFSQRNNKWPLFSNRLMFPIRDRMGRVIAFSGRDLSNSDKAPKYINSPDTIIYQKKDNFFGLYEAKNTISEGKLQPILCEGNFDVVSMHQAGLSSSIASLGTSFTEEQCLSIKKWFPSVNTINMLFDSDEAGQKSTERAILIINSNDLEASVHKLQSAKDASELLEREGADGLVREYNALSISGYNYLVQKNLNRYDITTQRGKSDFLKSLSVFYSGCQNAVQRDTIVVDLADRLKVSQLSIKEDLENSKPERREEKNETIKESSLKRGDISLDLYVMLYLANHREIFNLYRNKIRDLDLKDTNAKTLYSALENALREDIDSNELFVSLLPEECVDLKNMLYTSFALDEFTKENHKALDEAIDRIKLTSLEERRDIVLKSLQQNLGADTDQIARNMERKLELDREIMNLKEKINKVETGE